MASSIAVAPSSVARTACNHACSAWRSVSARRAHHSTKRRCGPDWRFAVTMPARASSTWRPSARMVATTIVACQRRRTKRWSRALTMAHARAK
eukprot:scaffold95681_cov31-Tisochrysis_lutea.AAC.6